MQLTNNTNITGSLATWLANDDYDHSKAKNEISVTSLLKPVREIVLCRQNIDLDTIADVSTLVESKMGTAIHDSIEDVWTNPVKLNKALTSLGYPKSVIDRIIVNPKNNDEIKENAIIVYLEKRTKKTVGIFVISGKFDFVIDGDLEDFKTTKTYAYQMGSNDQDYILQGSIYRWLNPDIIKNDILKIQYIFKDWNKLDSITKKDKGYPATKILTKEFLLMSLQETENYVVKRTNEIASLMDTPETDLPLCTDEELWAKPDVFKYYKDPNKTTRATKNFNSYSDANLHCTNKGVGVVLTVKGTVMKCKYCKALELCSQAANLVSAGKLIL